MRTGQYRAASGLEPRTDSVVAINVPDIQHGGLLHRGYCQGSVGKPIPGVSIRIVERDGDAELGIDEEGLILVKSASRMQGYYGDTAMTESVMRDGWYVTGDIGKLDKYGFLHITDRMARFSKIGGEMVPNGKIEAAIEAMIASRCRSRRGCNCRFCQRRETVRTDNRTQLVAERYLRRA